MKKIGIMLAGVAIPLALAAQNPAVSLQNYTSRIDAATADGCVITQQIGAPLGAPDVAEGDDVMYQGLFGVLSGVPAGGTVGVGFNYAAVADGVALSFCSGSKTLSVAVSGRYGEASLVIVDSSGQTVRNLNLKENNVGIDLSDLASGIYMAGCVVDNKFSRTLKFIVK